MQARLAARASRVFYGWWVALALCVIVFVGSAFFYYGLGSFFKPIVDEFGWSYAQTAFVLSIYQLEGGLMAPVVGFLFDRVGPRRLIMLGGAILGIGAFLLSGVESYPPFLTSVLLMSVGFSIGFSGIASATLANWFARRLSLALGVCYIGGGAGGMLVPALVWSIDRLGWRQTAIIIGLVIWAVVLPLSLLVSHRPEERGLTVDGLKPGPRELKPAIQTRASRPSMDSDVAVKEAIRTRAFWLLILVSALTWAAGAALVVHQIPYLVSVGMSPQHGAFVLALMALLSLPGRVGFGWLGDRFSRRYVMAMIFGLQALGVFAFAYAGNPWMLGLYLILYGPAMGGGVPLRPSLQAECFGRRAFGSIQGIIQGVGGLAGIGGSVYAGWVYDVVGSYQTAFTLLAATIALGVIPVLLIGRPVPAKQAQVAVVPGR